MRIKAAEALLRVQFSKTTEEIERTASNTNVTFASIPVVPTSPNAPFVIGVALLVGFVGSIAVAFFRASVNDARSDAMVV